LKRELNGSINVKSWRVIRRQLCLATYQRLTKALAALRIATGTVACRMPVFNFFLGGWTNCGNGGFEKQVFAGKGMVAGQLLYR